jgi:D-inositol-3-phosphate glycosyltransferase
MNAATDKRLTVAMLSLHSSPVGALGTRDTGGMSVVIRETVRHLSRRGHRVDIFTCRSAGGRTNTIPLYPNVRLVYVGTPRQTAPSKLGLYRQLPEVYRTIDHYRATEGRDYDVIHSHYWLSGRVGQWLSATWRAPHVITFHTLGRMKNCTGSGDMEPDVRIANEKRLAQTCDRAVVATDQERRHLVRSYGIGDERIRVIPLGVDLKRFKPGERRAARWRLGISQQESILLYVGRFVALKGIDRLIGALSHVQHPFATRLIMVGGDGRRSPTTRSLMRLAMDLGVGDRITFVGRRAHARLSDYYNAADAFVMPSHYESFGLVILEALACGTPVVATPVGIVPQVVENGLNGTIVDGVDPCYLAAGIDALLLRQKRSPIAPRKIRQTVLRFDWSKIVSSVIGAYRQLIGARAVGAA